MRWSRTTRIARSVARVTSLTAVLLLPATRALAQPVAVVLPTGTRALAQPLPAPAGQYSTSRLVLGGAAAGAAGMVAFGLAGGMIGGNTCRDIGNPDSCRGFEGALWGAALGHTVGIPVGVHLANGRAGKLSTSVLASAAIAGAGIAVGFGSGSDPVLAAAALTAPIAQLVSSVMIERATARRRAR
jgi:hypothetical protein